MPVTFSYQWQVALNDTPERAGARRALNLPADFTAHHLRATFATLVRQGRCDHRPLQKYLGHQAKDILGKHYEKVSVEQLWGEVVCAFEETWKRRDAEEPSKVALSWHSGSN